MLQDLKLALKLLRKKKAFAVTALLTLALCIGANTAIFTVLKSVVLDPLPFPESGRLVTMYNIYPGAGLSKGGANSTPDYFDRKQLTGLFDSVALIGDNGYDIGAEGSPRRIDGQYVTPSWFRVLRADPFLGRIFTEQESVQGNDHFAVLSYGLWQDMFAGDRGVMGKDIRLSGVSYRIIGVMPAGFATPGREARIWIPFSFTPRQMTDDARHNNNWAMLARLQPGVTIASAQGRIEILNRQNMERVPRFRKLLEDARYATKVVGLKDELVEDIRPTLYLLQGAVVLVLLIGCVNIASLMLVRGNVRMKEMAVRYSLGASRWRLGRQLLTEGVTLAALGGAMGAGVGYAGLRLLAVLGASELPRGRDLHMDSAVLVFTAAIAILTGLVFSSVPVFHLFRRNLNDVFRQTERTGTVERRSLWTRSALVVSQVSLAFVLLIGAALLSLSFARLLKVDPGFRPEHVLTARFSLPRARYRDDAQIRGFVEPLLASVRALAGVKAAGATSFLPFGSGSNASVATIEGYTLAPGEFPPVPAWSKVDAGYFQAIGVPLLQGRAFAEGDTRESQSVIVIDQFLARKYWPKGDAIGHRIRHGVGDRADSDSAFSTIVGVVGSVKNGDLAEQKMQGEVYQHYKQATDRAMHVVAKTARDDPQAISAIRGVLLRADPELPLFDVKSMPQRLAASTLNRRAAMVLCLIFAALALLLSAIGLYGVLAYTVTQRTREFGIRVALGANARDILGMVLGQGVRLAAIGLAIGVAAALAVTRLISAMLYAVKPADPLVFLLVAAALMLVALLAAFAPSVRALRIHPASALRYE